MNGWMDGRMDGWMDGWMEQTRTNIPIDQNNEKSNVIHILVNSKRIKIGEYE